MKNTTLCYIEQNDCWLMLHRVKKVNDINQDKWIGVGGKFEETESPYDCVIRETLEETGLTLQKPVYRGVVTFVAGKWETEQMHLFTADRFSGTLIDCDEGVLEWVPKSKVPDLPLWEGDKLFLKLIEKPLDQQPFFSLKLEYDGEDRFVGAVLDGEKVK